MCIYILYYLLISLALIIALYVHYIEYSSVDDFSIEIGCGEEYNLIIFIFIGLLWPIAFIVSIIMLILNFAKYVYNMCRK